MTELATRNTNGLTPTAMEAKVRYAQELSQAGMLPRQYQGQPANLLYAVEYAEMLGLAPMTAITGIHVIEGKPTASSALISGLVRRAGHKLRVSGDDEKAVAEVIRSDDPDWPFRAEWTLERAKKAGLTGKKVWQQYPAAMLKARAITEVARDACEEALSGMHYTPEELGAEVDVDGNVVDQTPAQNRPGATVAEAVAETNSESPMVSNELMRRMGALMRGEQMGAEEALPFVAEVIGREIANRSEMTTEEVDQVIHALEVREQERREKPADRFHGTDDDLDEPVDAELVEDAAAAEPEAPELGPLISAKWPGQCDWCDREFEEDSEIAMADGAPVCADCAGDAR